VGTKAVVEAVAVVTKGADADIMGEATKIAVSVLSPPIPPLPPK
jgi:hypothetical protein